MAFGPQLKDQQETIRIPLISAHPTKETDPTFPNTFGVQREQTFVNCFPVASKAPLGLTDIKYYVTSRNGIGQPETSVNATGSLYDLDFAAAWAVCAIQALPDTFIVVYLDNDGAQKWNVCWYRPQANTMGRIGLVSASTYAPGLTQIHVSELSLGIGNTPAVGVIFSDTTTGVSDGYVCLSASGSFSGQTWTGAATNDGLPIADTDFPANISGKVLTGPFVQLNENVYCLTTDGFIYAADKDVDGQAQTISWDTEGYIGASSYGDRAVGLCRYKHHLIAFGEYSMEFFNDEGLDAPCPLQPTQQAFIKMGAMGQKSFINYNDTIYWVSKSQAGGSHLYKLDGYTPVQLSGATFSSRLQNNNIDMQTISMASASHIIFNIRADSHYWFDDGVNTTDTVADGDLNFDMEGNLCYCIDSNTFWIWSNEHDYVGYSASRPTLLTATAQQYNAGDVTYVWSQIYQTSGTAFTYSIHPGTVIQSYQRVSPDGDDTYDSYRLNNATTIDYYRIPVLYATNYYDFGNEKRKFLRNVKIIGNNLRHHPADGNSADTPLGAFVVENLTLTLGVSKTQELDTNQYPEIIRSKVFYDLHDGYKVTGVSPSAAAATSITVSAIDADTPQTGTIFFDNTDGSIGYANIESWTGNTFTITSKDISLIETGGTGEYWVPEQQLEHFYNFNNFGAFRRIRFFILCNTFSRLSFEALELTIAQGTH